MRQRPTFHGKKSNSVVKSRVFAFHGDKTSTARKKRAPVPWSRRAKCQTRIKNIEKRNKRLLGQTSVSRSMAQLHLPFVNSSKRQLRSHAETLKQLRWSLVDDPRDRQTWGDVHHLRYKGLPTFTSENGPPWNLSPLESPHRAIVEHIIHVCWVWSRGPSLQIPRTWPVFSSVDWEREPLRLATSDSSDSKAKITHDGISSAQPVDLLTYDPHQHMTVIRCQLRPIQQPRTRIQWELLACMIPDGVKWSSQTAAGAKRRDARRHTGFLDYNQQSHDKDIWPQTALSALLYPLNSDSEYYAEKVRPNVLSEMHEPSEVGRMIMNVVATDAFPTQRRKTLNWPLFLSCGVSAPVIEYTCQVKCMNSPGGKNIQPLLFAAQEKGVCTHDPIERLALAFQPMITLFTLCYLDTRKSREELMPDWMVLFGAVYDEYGIQLLAFYPSFRLPNEAPDSVGNWGWGAGAFRISSDHTNMMTTPVWERGSAFAKLYRIQGHCRNVLEHLQRWDGFERVSQRLSDGATLS